LPTDLNLPPISELKRRELARGDEDEEEDEEELIFQDKELSCLDVNDFIRCNTYFSSSSTAAVSSRAIDSQERDDKEKFHYPFADRFPDGVFDELEDRVSKEVRIYCQRLMVHSSILQLLSIYLFSLKSIIDAADAQSKSTTDPIGAKTELVDIDDSSISLLRELEAQKEMLLVWSRDYQQSYAVSNSKLQRLKREAQSCGVDVDKLISICSHIVSVDAGNVLEDASYSTDASNSVNIAQIVAKCQVSILAF
jgi:hypothetical protein